MPYEYFAQREDPKFDSFTAEPMSGALGATLSDIDITAPLDEHAAELFQDQPQGLLVPHAVLHVGHRPAVHPRPRRL